MKSTIQTIVTAIMLLFILVCPPATFAQGTGNIPMERCGMCMGQGFLPYSGICLHCNGTGRVPSRAYELEMARITGEIKGEVDVAKIQLASGKEFAAYQRLCNIYNKYIERPNVVALPAYWIGVCMEYGFGVDVNQAKAQEFYRFASENGNDDGTNAYYRILNRGFITANSTNRNQFIQQLKIETNNFVPYNSIPQQQSFGNNGGMGNDKMECKSCRGSGRCSMCAGRGEHMSNGVRSDCMFCHGSGQCAVCRGRGKF